VGRAPADPASVAEALGEIAQRAGERIAELRERRALDVQHKPGDELVTAADLASDRLIRDALIVHFPGCRIVSEEVPSGLDAWSGESFVVDPLDGTVNFARGHAHVGISIAYAVDGVVEAGVVHAPFARETFAAVRGAGATHNGVALHTRPVELLSDALVATGFPHDRAARKDLLERLTRVVPAVRDIRRLASPALDLCWLACGRLDAWYETVGPWDVAAGGLIAREAGARRGHFAPRVRELPDDVCGDHVLFASPGIFDELLPLVSG
jgi:myo-inositol-1(or 4)-monophosphatase